MANEDNTNETVVQAREMAGIPIASQGTSGAPRRIFGKKEILATDDRKYREVNMERWWGKGVFVRIRSLNAGERDTWEASHVINRKGDQVVRTQTVRASLVALSLVDENDQLLFSTDEVAALQAKSAGAINDIYAVCAAMNGITDKDVEELAGN